VRYLNLDHNNTEVWSKLKYRTVKEILD